MSKNIEKERQDSISSYLKMVHQAYANDKDNSPSSYLFMKNLFFNAILANNLEIVVDLLEKYPSFLQEKDERGFNSMAIACSGGDIEMISFFYSKGLDITGEEDTIPLLHLALTRKDKDEKIIEFLLNKGANPCFSDAKGYDALDFCLKMRWDLEVYEMLFNAVKKRHGELVKTNKELNQKYATLFEAHEKLIKTNENLKTLLATSRYINEELKKLLLPDDQYELDDNFPLREQTEMLKLTGLHIEEDYF